MHRSHTAHFGMMWTCLLVVATAACLRAEDVELSVDAAKAGSGDLAVYLWPVHRTPGPLHPRRHLGGEAHRPQVPLGAGKEVGNGLAEGSRLQRDARYGGRLCRRPLHGRLGQGRQAGPMRHPAARHRPAPRQGIRWLCDPCPRRQANARRGPHRLGARRRGRREHRFRSGRQRL